MATVTSDSCEAAQAGFYLSATGIAYDGRWELVHRLSTTNRHPDHIRGEPSAIKRPPGSKWEQLLITPSAFARLVYQGVRSADWARANRSGLRSLPCEDEETERAAWLPNNGLLECPERLVINALRTAIHVEESGPAGEDQRPNVPALDDGVQVQDFRVSPLRNHAVTSDSCRGETAPVVCVPVNYKLTILGPAPGKLFCSMTLYDLDTRSLMDTDQVKVEIGSLREKQKAGTIPRSYLVGRQPLGL